MPTYLQKRLLLPGVSKNRALPDLWGGVWCELMLIGGWCTGSARTPIRTRIRGANSSPSQRRQQRALQANSACVESDPGDKISPCAWEAEECRVTTGLHGEGALYVSDGVVGNAKSSRHCRQSP